MMTMVMMMVVVIMRVMRMKIRMMMMKDGDRNDDHNVNHKDIDHAPTPWPTEHTTQTLTWRANRAHHTDSHLA